MKIFTPILRNFTPYRDFATPIDRISQKFSHLVRVADICIRGIAQ